MDPKGGVGEQGPNGLEELGVCFGGLERYPWSLGALEVIFQHVLKKRKHSLILETISIFRIPNYQKARIRIVHLEIYNFSESYSYNKHVTGQKR
jgi:hypothetical protein